VSDKDVKLCPICLKPIKPEDAIVRVYKQEQEDEIHLECYRLIAKDPKS